MEDQVTEVGNALIDESHNIASQLTQIDGYFVKEEQNKGGQVTEEVGSAPVEKLDIEIQLVDLKQDLGDELTKLGFTLLVESEIASNEVTGVHVSVLEEKCETGTQGADICITLVEEQQSKEAHVVDAGRSVIDEKCGSGDRCSVVGIQDQNLNIGTQCSEDEASLPDKKSTSTDAKEEENGEKEEEEEEEEAEEEKEENQEIQFSVGDFVWGKIKSHPWWPGQICDPLNASECAAKRRKKDRLLVAYFGDGTFAWCNNSQLRPFQPHFQEMSKQSNSKNFQNAVKEVQEEIGRLLELEITCSCVPDGIRCKPAQPVAINSGIREGVTVPKGNIGPLALSAFEPAAFLECLKDLAKFVFAGNGLELTAVQIWVSAIFRARGYGQLPVFHGYQETAENVQSNMTHLDGQTAGSSQILVEDGRLSSPVVPGVGKAGSTSSPNQPQSLEKRLYQRKKRSVAELIAEKNTSDVENEDDEQKVLSKWYLSSKKSKKTKHSASPLSKQRRNKSLAAPEDSEKVAAPKYPKVSWVGESISRIASQLTGSPPIVKCSVETFQKKVSKADHGRHKTCGSLSFRTPKESQKPLGLVEKGASTIKMLPELRLAAVDPLYARECHSSMDFFVKFRSSLYKKGADFGTYKEYLAKDSNETDTITYSRPGGDTGPKKKKLKDGASSQSPKKNSRGGSAKDSPETDTITHSCSQGNTEQKKWKVKDGASSQSPKKKSTALSAKDCNETDLITCSSSEGNTERTKRKRKEGASSQSPQKKSRWSVLEPADVEPIRGANHGQSNKENSAALLLTFAPSFTLPSKADVITICGKFGPLKELETEVLEDSGCAQVVFLRSCDAEAAFKSLEKGSIFGPTVVSSRLRYLSGASKAVDGSASPSQPLARDPLFFVQQNLEMMTSMLAKSVEQEAGSADKSSLESRARIVDEMKGLLKKLSVMVGSST